MRIETIVKVSEILLLVLIVIAGFGQAVLQLWNWLVPSIFGLRILTFWEAVGLLGLSWILFGGLRGGRSYTGHWRRRNDRWQVLTPEQRAQLQNALERKCSEQFGSPAIKPES